MLRHEASAAYETGASCLSMTAYLGYCKQKVFSLLSGLGNVKQCEESFMMKKRNV
jgi:hypothetical protein